MIPLRQKLRPSLAIRGKTSQRSISRPKFPQGLGLVLATLLLWSAFWAALAVQPSGNPDLRPGQPSPVNIQARRTVNYNSEWRTERDRTRAENDSDTVVYNRDINILTQQRALLSDLLLSMTDIRNDPNLRLAERRTKLAALPNSTIAISDELAAQIARLSDSDWENVRHYTLDTYDRGVGEYRFAIDEQAVTQLRAFSFPYWATLLTPQTNLQRLIVLFASSHIRSNLVVDEVATRAKKEAARAAVKPVNVTILQGESIVRAGDVVTPDVQEKLVALGELRLTLDWSVVGGKGLFAALLAFGFASYVRMAQREKLSRVRPLMMVVGLSVATILMARLAAASGWNWMYAFPLGVVGILLTTLFNSGVALFMLGLLAAPIALISGGLPVGLVLLVGGVAGVFTVGRGEQQRSFVLAGVAMAVVTALGAVALSLASTRDTLPEDLAALALLGVANGAISAIIALGLYNVAGHIAGVVTPLQLMELAHPARPLLRKLIREAPGTYYHSVAVGNLAESAAEAIGADALLLRVASYYHDIGKTVRPFFFTDNQSDRENVHNDLDPQTSAEIIADHVREGITLAKQAGLPTPIIDFIATHHGTSVIRHFYQLALQQQDSVNIERFRYPGPRPQTREQAIMMLSDTVEATVRSKMQHGKVISAREGTPRGDGQTLEELVSSILEERIRSGQLDESPLTLQDIAKIRQAFVNTLQGIYHPRVEYAPQMIKGV